MTRFGERDIHIPDDVDSSWLALAKKILRELTNETPEQNDVLRALGIYREDVYYRKLMRQGKTREEIKKIKARRSAAGTEAKNIRDGIFTRLDQAFDAIVSTMEEKESDQPSSETKPSISN